jgi:hypothetical protein
MRVHGNGALRGCCDAVKRTRHVASFKLARSCFGTVAANSGRVSTPLEWTRGAKTVSSVTIKARPQGLLTPKPEESIVELEDDGPAYPTVIQQALNNMRRFSHCLVLTRVGNFYEV